MHVKIKPNTFYLTRSGQKAFVGGCNPFESNPHQEFVGFISGSVIGGTEIWDENGRWWSIGEHRNDLVAELPEASK